MVLELKVCFSSPDRYVVQYDDCETKPLGFVSPLVQGDRDDVRWYLETYGAAYTSEPDDLRAKEIEEKLPQWGTALFEAIFGEESALSQYRTFEATNAENKLLTIASNQPEILSLPWELLCDGRGVPFLLRDPTIGIRRCLDRNLGEVDRQIQPKQCLRMIYLTSRPEGTGFFDPRIEAMPVLEALEREAGDAIEIEFLRPATFKNLSDRLASTGNHHGKPSVDILHFDGHGSFNPSQNQGFLEFEDIGSKRHSVSAEEIGELLQEHAVGLMVLSACQSAQVAGEDPMGSVAVQLNAAGVPAVLAMSYSILVEGARRLFGAFYRNLLAGQGVGASLDAARVNLFRDRARGERQRWQKRIVLELQDWFLPALYQVGSDVSLLLPREIIATPLSNEAVPKNQDFVGRAWELWEIERWFVRNRRRITISGFGGQGKTALAQEAGRWFIRTGLFERSGFVSFSGFQNLETADALRYAVAVLGQELGEGFLDEEAVRIYLQNTPTLIILDNLEALGDEGLTDLLAAAVGWSEAGESRVLLTTRSPRLHHAGYPTNDKAHPHYAMRLDGWKEEDAIAYFQQSLQSLSNAFVQLPTRESLSAIFRKVDFQPLAVRLLAESIKTQPCIALEQALDDLLNQEDSNDPNRSLKASLNLSLQRLDPALQEWLPRLGVFQGGASENMVQEIAEPTEDTWQQLRHELEAAGLIQVEYLLDNTSPYLKFHPNLAPVLWELLELDACAALVAQHQDRYYGLSGVLYSEDFYNPLPSRALVLRELPNLLFAVRGALAAAAHNAVEFVNQVNWFLNCFGMRKDQDDLMAQTTFLAEVVGSQSWFLTRINAASQLFGTGRANAAIPLLEEILQGLAVTPTHERSLTLWELGRCYLMMGQLHSAETCLREGFTVTEALIAADPKNRGYLRQKGVLLVELANVLKDSRRYREARQAYETALAIRQEIGDDRGAAVINGQLGTLAIHEGNLTEAVERHQRAISAFEQFNELQQAAIGYHQLGMVYREAQQWDAAERAYRQSALLKESQGMIFGNIGVANTWGALAIICANQGKFDAAEYWHRKTLDANKQSNYSLGISKDLQNLADLLQGQSDRLAEAQQLAEEALTIQQTLDPAAAQIWKNYQILAEIADKQGQIAAVRTYRRQMRQSYNASPDTQDQLQQPAAFIANVVIATQSPDVQQQLEAALKETDPSWQNLAAAIRQILSGERDEDTLCKALGYYESAIICTILRDLGAPSSMPAINPLQQSLQSPAAQALIAQLAEVPEGQALLQAIQSGDEAALQQFLALLQAEAAEP